MNLCQRSIDASAAIKVAVDRSEAKNDKKLKNPLGADRPSQKVFLDFSFQGTLPRAICGMAETIERLKKEAIWQKKTIKKMLELARSPGRAQKLPAPSGQPAQNSARLT